MIVTYYRPALRALRGEALIFYGYYRFEII